MSVLEIEMAGIRDVEGALLRRGMIVLANGPYGSPPEARAEVLGYSTAHCLCIASQASQSSRRAVALRFLDHYEADRVFYRDEARVEVASPVDRLATLEERS